MHFSVVVQTLALVEHCQCFDGTVSWIGRQHVVEIVHVQGDSVVGCHHGPNVVCDTDATPGSTDNNQPRRLVGEMGEHVVVMFCSLVGLAEAYVTTAHIYIGL
ncbi:hypothetical protein NCU17188 [Neurospora crassa OR74A]|uniref:Secreted protein n=1 Tax=Neurospora crassa (strain ATCC 24698 / 74-OR23-1A / CBS 708.71 / DSM 1257 / FGSC 987) TaxID=367110 RepID=V5IKC8_NEUCR|nr:hypothetical protein NCU17188 [Neurospora crassa OR74A]ESA41873.1 hypothetical protein NCU17188 [Neurospora crassa OR74A]|eukprot:XP_011395359.1 hypothetical protein NCU17188 [Neurospora crassa OR74A]